MEIESEIIDVLKDSPGLCCHDVWLRVAERVRANGPLAKWLAKKFGAETFLIRVLCIPTQWTVDIMLDRLEDRGLVTSFTKLKDGKRVLHFFACVRPRWPRSV